MLNMLVDITVAIVAAVLGLGEVLSPIVGIESAYISMVVGFSLSTTVIFVSYKAVKLAAFIVSSPFVVMIKLAEAKKLAAMSAPATPVVVEVPVAEPVVVEPVVAEPVVVEPKMSFIKALLLSCVTTFDGVVSVVRRVVSGISSNCRIAFRFVVGTTSRVVSSFFSNSRVAKHFVASTARGVVGSTGHGVVFVKAGYSSACGQLATLFARVGLVFGSFASSMVQVVRMLPVVKAACAFGIVFFVIASLHSFSDGTKKLSDEAPSAFSVEVSAYAAYDKYGIMQDADYYEYDTAKDAFADVYPELSEDERLAMFVHFNPDSHLADYDSGISQEVRLR